ncbi:hypothetical protein DFH11DRAFT_259530 [Phellopilus nigrolimitatus]|nr:hypothetical protein DFH11DRAFT_259530 [Phellopilus nigrolimitatus]
MNSLCNILVKTRIATTSGQNTFILSNPEKQFQRGKGSKRWSLCNIYQRAVQIPLENVEMLWKDYEVFEDSLNNITATKFLKGLSPVHMQARCVISDSILGRSSHLRTQQMACTLRSTCRTSQHISRTIARLRAF